jgi:hypothetical protein
MVRQYTIYHQEHPTVKRSSSNHVIGTHTISLSPRERDLRSTLHRIVLTNSNLLHVYYTADAFARVHIAERVVDTFEWLAVSDKLIDLKLPRHVVIHKLRELAAALYATEGTAFPNATGDELERYRSISGKMNQTRVCQTYDE